MGHVSSTHKQLELIFEYEYPTPQLLSEFIYNIQIPNDFVLHKHAEIEFPVIIKNSSILTNIIKLSLPA